jgi:hypothetical protein
VLSGKSFFTVALGLATLGVSQARADEFSLMQERLFSALKNQGVVSRETQLITAQYVCTLVVGGEAWSVVNTIEYIRGAQVPRARNQIVILDSNLKPVRTFSYADQYPLFCRSNSLYLHGDFSINNVEPFGNTLTFDRNREVKVTSTDINALPIEPTAGRASYLIK